MSDGFAHMDEKGEGLLNRLAMKRVLTRWRRAAAESMELDLSEIATLRRQAKRHRDQINRLLHLTEPRLQQAWGGTSFPARLPGTDWEWRPDLWRGPLSGVCHVGAHPRAALGEGVALFHDCRESEIVTRQIRNSGAEIASAYGLRLDVFHFDGSFLSLAIDLPQGAVQGLKTRHLIRLDMVVEMDRPLEFFARLNVKHGPNVEQLVREVTIEGDRCEVEFDLFYSELNEKRVEQAWVDLILERPAQNQINLRDLTLSRRPRAEL